MGGGRSRIKYYMHHLLYAVGFKICYKQQFPDLYLDPIHTNAFFKTNVFSAFLKISLSNTWRFLIVFV